MMGEPIRFVDEDPNTATMATCIRNGWGRPKCCVCGRFVPRWSFSRDWETGWWEDDTVCARGEGCRREGGDVVDGEAVEETDDDPA